MEDANQNFLNAAKDLAQKLKKLHPASLVLFHHNDADGLSSGAITKRALERFGLKPRSVCLEKPYEAALSRILEDDSPPEAVFFVDFASGMLDTISALSSKNSTVFLLDHHTINGKLRPQDCILNPLNFGISGHKDACAATVAYCFAEALNPLNVDLAPIALIGAAGDGQIIKGNKPLGLHSYIVEKCGGTSLADGEYNISLPDSYSAFQYAGWLNSLGSFGYFNGGSDIGMKGVLDGFNHVCRDKAEELSKNFWGEMKRYSSLQPAKKLSNKILIQDLGKDFSDYGVKSVGLLCDSLMNEYENEELLIVGLQDIRQEIPGLGNISLHETKVSFRLTKPLTLKAERGEFLGIPKIAEITAKATKGFLDACHLHAGAITIPKDSKEIFIKALSELLD